ncbi:hypothetical protein LDENG_00140980 [Lucifuga dentata]|nr:hypothetical protein LDENG_00140980 [Lucifuga dentata]
MERLTINTRRRGPSQDEDTGQYENATGGRGKSQGGAQEDRRRIENRGKKQSSGKGQGQPQETDVGEGVGVQRRPIQRGERGGKGARRAEEEKSVAIGGNREKKGVRSARRDGAQRSGDGMVEWRGGYYDRHGGRRDKGTKGAGKGQERNGGRLLSMGRGGPPHVRKLGYKTLEELSEKDPSEVAITLSSNPALQAVLGETHMRQDLVELMCLVVSKAFKSRIDRGTLQHLAGIVKDSAFLRTIVPHYVADMASEFNPVRRKHYPQHLGNILTLVSEVLSIFPASSVHAVSMLLTLLQASINSLRASGVDILPQMEEEMENLKGLVNHLQERSREGTLCSDRDTYALLATGGDNPGGEQQQDFRTIPIYPTPEELHQEEKPFLRPNLTSRCYTNTHLYLDTHFRLLREDFVRPLREGIQQLLWSQMEMGRNDKALRAKRFDDIHVYFDTKLVEMKCASAGIAYIVKFDTKLLKFVRWQNSKRLLYGSLVCLSYDHFESFLFATVSDRDPKDLQKGKIQLIFTEESRRKLATIQTDQSFLMVETSAYFEAYRYVLEGLQEQKEDELPFQRYIVECSSDVQPPVYLRRNDTYDLSSIADHGCKDKIVPFHSLQPDAWPSMEKLGLDESQMRAFQLALTKELAIIQGPPGTGKTYVGLKIAQALLNNQDLWRPRIRTSPMLVVCYTNHALDQFLEGICKFLRRGIVRVGGRSNSEVLKQFNLRELSHHVKLPSNLHSANSEILKQLHEVQKEFESHSIKMSMLLKGILHEHVLEGFISYQHWNTLCQRRMQDGFVTYGEKKPSLMMEWLVWGCSVVQQGATDNANGNEDFEIGESMEVEEQDLIEIAEEADLIQAERFIEDNTDHRDIQKERNKKAMEDAVREVEEMMLAVKLENAEIQPGQSDEGWEIPREHKKKIKSRIKAELENSSAMTEEEEDAIFDVWSLSLADRWRLYRLWVTRYRAELRVKSMELEQAYQNAADRLADVRRHESLSVLKNAKVIGMTTTGAAKFRKVLQEVCPCVVIVEEAAEVLEAHIITTLSQACEHLILIGDHQQLRPSTTVYELAKNFSLEVSMFERLVKIEIPFVRLSYQHRMRPDIARLLTPHIYSDLQNHPSVMDYEDIKGLNTNLFFVEHNHLEEEIKDGRSRKNQHEAMFVVRLCRYLLLQEYKPEQITILTTYTGQLYCLRELMPASQFSGVKVHVVDKYQGEENDIVLLSLVRSNKEGKVGFLNSSNRVCVALSRARKGFFCIGNSVMLSQVELWSNIFHTLREKGQIGAALTLCCQNHPDRQIKAACDDDFKQAPEGGCNLPCEFRLDCGHVCTRACHPYDAEHKKYKCGKQCTKILCDLGHRCPLVCHKPCPKCPVKVEKIIPKCQHKQMVPCHQDPETFVCQEPCQKMLQCGHPCDSVCGKPCTKQCLAKITFKLRCGHSQQGPCFYKILGKEPNCWTPCKQQLKCGHDCKGNCHGCFQGRYHFSCFHQCERLLVCSHKCREPCTHDCPPCKRPCENCCIHSKCKKPCGQPCVPCAEPCAWKCPHLSCSKLCHEPCDRPPCTQPCDKTLKCGHPCIGLCGDKCPTKCRICNQDEVREIFFGTEDDPEACFIQLEDCGHIFESTGMDRWMGENQQTNDEEQVAIKLKECPKCRTPVRKNLRYGSHINRSLAEIEAVKKKINGHQADIKEYKKALKKWWEENLGFQMQEEYMQEEYIIDRLKDPNLTANDLWILENKLDFEIRVKKLQKIERENMSEMHAFTFSKHVEEFMQWLNNAHQKFTDQQVSDLQRELMRLTLLAELNACCHMADKRGGTDKAQSEIQTTRNVLEKPGQFTDQDEHQVREALKDLDDKLPRTGLGISEEERKMIVSAVKLPPGHWYKCPNGHVYLITECGGAMESRRCPDCNATIGGSNHALVSDNQVASEMDGAQHAAWSEANNLLNFDPLDF